MMAMEIPFNEAVNGVTKVRVYLFRIYNTAEKQYVEHAKDPNLSQAQRPQLVGRVMVLVINKLSKVRWSCKWLVISVMAKAR